MKIAFDLIFTFILSLIGWLIFVPLSICYPKKKNRIVFIGSYKGFFSGNIKYLYIYVKGESHIEKNDVYFFTEDPALFNLLRKMGEPVVFFPSIKGLRILLSSFIAIVDQMEWVKNGKFHLLFGSKKVQLWHGIGFKKIELMNIQSEIFQKRNWVIKLLTKIYRLIEGRYPQYDLVVSTSEFYSQNVFSKVFKFKALINAGYPRNDIFFKNNIVWPSLVSVNCDMECIEIIKEYCLKNKKIIIYMPTFRDRDKNILESDAWDFKRFNNYCEKNNIVMVIKEHPHPFFKKKKIVYSNIIYYNSTRDIYPLLPYTDLLITDYSSIYMDYLLLNKPIIFFPYDYQDYITNNREIQFDYDWITPGIKCLSQKELEHEIYQILMLNKDHYKEKRAEIKNIAFKYHDGKSAERIWDAIQDRYLNDPKTT